MADDANEFELKDRLELIESMLAAGRRTTESWGWTFVLWGAAYYTAIAWGYFGHSPLAWPVTMVAAGILTFLLASRKRQSETKTLMGRAVCSIWVALGISMFLLFMSMSFAHILNERVFVAVACAMLGMANATSGLILKWKMQLACSVVWLTSAVVAGFGTRFQSFVVFLVALFFCQIVFGIYAMVRESRRHQRGAVHA